MKNTNTGEVPVGVILLLFTVAIIIAGGVVGHQQGKKDLADYRRYLQSAEKNLAEARAKAESDRRPAYEKIKATDEKIAWDGGAIFTFTLTNGSSHPIRKFDFQAQFSQYSPVFQVIAKEKAWSELRTPLQPGESRSLSLSSNDSSAWGSSTITSALAQTHGFGFSIFITGAEGIDGVSFKEKEGFDSSDIERYEKEANQYRAEIKKRQ